MKRLINKIIAWIKWLWLSLSEEVKTMVPVAIKITEGVKKVIDSPVSDVFVSILGDIIPGELDNKIMNKVVQFVRNELPSKILALKFVEGVTEIEDPEERLKAILEKISFNSEAEKNAFYHSLSVMIIDEILEDGDLSWSDMVLISEFYYSYKFKNVVQ